MLNRKKKFNLPKGYTLKAIDEGIFDRNQQGAEWYVSGYGSELIASVQVGDNEAKIYCCGEMRYEWGEFSLRYAGAILKETQYKTDKQLSQAIDRGEIYVENNPWFVVEINDDYDDFGDVAFSVGEAIGSAVERLKEIAG